jgi:hypothetical protein
MKNGRPPHGIWDLLIILASSFYLWGCSGGTFPTATSVAPPTVAYVWGNDYPTYYVDSPQTILEYSTASPETGSSIGTLILPTTPCNSGEALAVDSQGQLYVACFNTSSPPQILVYPPNSTGTAVPSRTIEMSADYYEIDSLAVDANGRLYVGALESTESPGGAFAVIVYAAGASGLAAPLRTIPLAANDGLIDVSADASGNVYVAGYPEYNYSHNLPLGFVNVYSSNANGSVAPMSTIDFPYNIYGIGVDTTGNVFVSTAGVNSGGNVAAIQEFVFDANGYARPINTISLVNLPEELAGMGVRGGPVRFDAAGNMFTPLAVGNEDTATTFILYRFGPTATNVVSIAKTVPTDAYNLTFAVN